MRLSRFFPFLLSISPAYAHSVFGETASFWSGAAHVVTSPIAIAILLGVGSRIAAQPPGVAYLRAIAALILATGIAATTFESAILGPLAAALIGGLAALSPRHHRIEVVPLGLFAGAAIGSAIELDATNWVSCLGAAAASGYVAMMLFEGLERLERFSPVPRRVLGSWVAALGLLLLALAMRG